jgi:cation transport regulator ChaC
MLPDRVVAEGVLFRVEDRILDDERQRLELREELPQDAQLEKLLEADGRAGRAEQDLEELLRAPNSTRRAGS